MKTVTVDSTAQSYMSEDTATAVVNACLERPDVAFNSPYGEYGEQRGKIDAPMFKDIPWSRMVVVS